MHAYRNPEHERRLAARLERLGFEHVACSAELAPRIKLLPRLETAVVDAYLGPLIQGYLGRVSEAAGDAMKLLVMTSAGGLNDAVGYRAKDSLLSGPAAGVVGATRAGLRHGRSRLIGFDMGGTSTDVARFDGKYEYVYEHGLGETRLAAPALGIESVVHVSSLTAIFHRDALKMSSSAPIAGSNNRSRCHCPAIASRLSKKPVWRPAR